MSGTPLISKLEAQIQSKSIDEALLIVALESSILEERGIAYEILTSKHRLSISHFKPNSIMPLLCLDYLIDCIKIDLLNPPCNYCHTRADALFELQVPLDPYWEEKNCAISIELYWSRLEIFLIERHPDYLDAFVTHFLEGADPAIKVNERMLLWGKHDSLRRYSEALRDLLI